MFLTVSIYFSWADENEVTGARFATYPYWKRENKGKSYTTTTKCHGDEHPKMKSLVFT